jgi:hypothetical protein
MFACESSSVLDPSLPFSSSPFSPFNAAAVVDLMCAHICLLGVAHFSFTPGSQTKLSSVVHPTSDVALVFLPVNVEQGDGGNAC